MMTAETKTTPLQAERTARRWSRARLAREAGITEQTIVRAEKGLVQTSLDTWARIAAALEVPIHSLVPERAHGSNLPETSQGTPHTVTETTMDSANTANGTSRGRNVANENAPGRSNGA